MKILALLLPLLFIGGDLLAAPRTKDAEAHRAQVEKLEQQLRREKEKHDAVKVRLRQHQSEGNGREVARDRDELKKLDSQMRDTKRRIREERRKAREADRGEPPRK